MPFSWILGSASRTASAPRTSTAVATARSGPIRSVTDASSSATSADSRRSDADSSANPKSISHGRPSGSRTTFASFRLRWAMRWRRSSATCPQIERTTSSVSASASTRSSESPSIRSNESRLASESTSATVRSAGVRTPSDARLQGHERLVFDLAPRGLEGSLVADVAQAQEPVRAEQEVGAPLLLAEHLDEERRPVGPHREVRDRPPRVDVGPPELAERRTAARHGVGDLGPARPPVGRPQREQQGRAGRHPDADRDQGVAEEVRRRDDPEHGERDDREDDRPAPRPAAPRLRRRRRRRRPRQIDGIREPGPHDPRGPLQHVPDQRGRAPVSTYWSTSHMSPAPSAAARTTIPRRRNLRRMRSNRATTTGVTRARTPTRPIRNRSRPSGSWSNRRATSRSSDVSTSSASVANSSPITVRTNATRSRRRSTGDRRVCASCGSSMRTGPSVGARSAGPARVLIWPPHRPTPGTPRRRRRASDPPAAGAARPSPGRRTSARSSPRGLRERRARNEREVVRHAPAREPVEALAPRSAGAAIAEARTRRPGLVRLRPAPGRPRPCRTSGQRHGDRPDPGPVGVEPELRAPGVDVLAAEGPPGRELRDARDERGGWERTAPIRINTSP